MIEMQPLSELPQPRWVLIRGRVLNIVPPSSEKDESIIVEGVKTFTKDWMSKIIESHDAGFREIRRVNPKISKPAMISRYLQKYSHTRLDDLTTLMGNELAKSQSPEEQKPMLEANSAMFDFWFGVFGASTPIIDAEEMITGDFNSRVAGKLANLNEFINTGNQVAIALKMEKRATKTAKSLIDDPTGKSIMHAMAEKEYPKTSGDFISHALMSAGAKFAEEAYNNLYSLA